MDLSWIKKWGVTTSHPSSLLIWFKCLYSCMYFLSWHRRNFWTYPIVVSLHKIGAKCWGSCCYLSTSLSYRIQSDEQFAKRNLNLPYWWCRQSWAQLPTNDVVSVPFYTSNILSIHKNLYQICAVLIGQKISLLFPFFRVQRWYFPST